LLPAPSEIMQCRVHEDGDRWLEGGDLPLIVLQLLFRASVRIADRLAPVLT
jgi:hypothetical protein